MPQPLHMSGCEEAAARPARRARARRCRSTGSGRRSRRPSRPAACRGRGRRRRSRCPRTRSAPRSGACSSAASLAQLAARGRARRARRRPRPCAARRRRRSPAARRAPWAACTWLPSGIDDRVAGVLPAHVLVALRRAASGTPGSRRRRGRRSGRSTRGSAAATSRYVAQQRVVAEPLPRLVQRDQVERRGVGGAVVRRVRDRAGSAPARRRAARAGSCPARRRASRPSRSPGARPASRSAPRAKPGLTIMFCRLAIRLSRPKSGDEPRHAGGGDPDVRAGVVVVAAAARPCPRPTAGRAGRRPRCADVSSVAPSSHCRCMSSNRSCVQPSAQPRSGRVAALAVDEDVVDAQVCQVAPGASRTSKVDAAVGVARAASRCSRGR